MSQTAGGRLDEQRHTVSFSFNSDPANYSFPMRILQFLTWTMGLLQATATHFYTSNVNGSNGKAYTRGGAKILII